MLKKLRGWLFTELNSNNFRRFHFKQTIIWSIVIGLLGGIVVSAYLYIMNGLVHAVWHSGKHAIYALLPTYLQKINPNWIITLIGGFIVGITIKIFGKCGEISAVVNNINMEKGRIDIRQTPAMTATSLMSIAFGGSAGPEAPLVQIVGSFASSLGDKLKLSSNQVRTFTFCGMGAALSALFGSPVGGALFALEIPHQRGLEYYEAILPAIVSSAVSFAMCRLILGYHGRLIKFMHLPVFTMQNLIWSALIGVFGAIAATLFVFIFRTIENGSKLFGKHYMLLAMTGGLGIGLLQKILPKNFPITSLFWGELQLNTIVHSRNIISQHYGFLIGVGILVLLAIIKMTAVGFTLHSGFRGGFIFPMFFIGGVLGLSISLGTHYYVPVAIAILCMMAAVNVAVTKTPVSTSLILLALSGISMLPMLITASMVSFLLTTKINLIKTQRHRQVDIIEENEPILAEVD
ncbi:MAG TPA: chloride channel protein [Balneolales bacterium]|nr:chloride channel protein [Balneolales bacterium]